MFAITFLTFAVHAQQLPGTAAGSHETLNLTNAQVMKIQAQLLARAEETRTLTQNVHAAREALNTAVQQGDAVRTAMALLSLDAAEKALKTTETANQRNLMSVLNDSQKQLIKGYSAQVPVSD
jgi:hypothetical protein